MRTLFYSEALIDGSCCVNPMWAAIGSGKPPFLRQTIWTHQSKPCTTNIFILRLDQTYYSCSQLHVSNFLVGDPLYRGAQNNNNQNDRVALRLGLGLVGSSGKVLLPTRSQLLLMANGKSQAIIQTWMITDRAGVGGCCLPNIKQREKRTY